MKMIIVLVPEVCPFCGAGLQDFPEDLDASLY
jgi:hypothetical protein